MKCLAVLRAAVFCIILRLCSADQFNALRDESYWADSSRVEVPPGDLSKRFSDLSTTVGKFTWILSQGEYLMPPHVANIVVQSNIRILGAGINTTTLLFQGHTRMLLLNPGSSLTIQDSTLSGVTVGKLSNFHRRLG